MSGIVLYTDIACSMGARKIAKTVGARVDHLKNIDRKAPMDMTAYDTVYIYHNGIGYKKILPMLVSFLENNRHQIDKIKLIINVWHSEINSKEQYIKNLDDIRRHIDYFKSFCKDEPRVVICTYPAEREYSGCLMRDLGYELHEFNEEFGDAKILIIPTNDHSTQTDGVYIGRLFGYLAVIPICFSLFMRCNLAIFMAVIVMTLAAIILCEVGLELQRKIPPATFYKRMQNLDGTPKEWPGAERKGRILVWAAIVITISIFVLIGLDAMGLFGLTDLTGNPR